MLIYSELLSDMAFMLSGPWPGRLREPPRRLDRRRMVARCIDYADAIERLPTTKVIFGVVAIARSEVESVEDIRERLSQALHHIDAERLIAAPDCGLGLLGREIAMTKLKNMCSAAHSL